MGAGTEIKTSPALRKRTCKVEVIGRAWCSIESTKRKMCGGEFVGFSEHQDNPAICFHRPPELGLRRAESRGEKKEKFTGESTKVL